MRAAAIGGYVRACAGRMARTSSHMRARGGRCYHHQGWCLLAVDKRRRGDSQQRPFQQRKEQENSKSKRAHAEMEMRENGTTVPCEIRTRRNASATNAEHWRTRMDEVDGDLERRGEEGERPATKQAGPPRKFLYFSGGTKYRGGEDGEDLCVCMPQIQMLKTFTFASPHSHSWSVPVCKYR